MITGFALAPASTEDQPLAETFFALRRHPHPRASSVGAPATGPYLTDEGFEGRGRHRRWARDYGAVVICPPPRRRTGVPPWPRAWRRWLAGKRRVVETAIAGLVHAFRLGRERPHGLDGLQARLAAKVALHNSCLWLNRPAQPAALGVRGPGGLVMPSISHQAL